MNKTNLFKVIIKAYYENCFEEVVTDLIEKESDKEQAANLISALCGVELAYDTNYASKLKEAIKYYSSDHKVVTRVKPCTMNCTSSSGKTNCQIACIFNAIVIDYENHTTVMDNSKCTDCGFCIEVCPNKNYIDKIEFLPLIKSL